MDENHFSFLYINSGVSASGATVFFIILIIMIICHLKRSTSGQQSIFRKRRKLVDHNVEVFMQSYESSMPRRYSYREIKRITNSFRDKLGQGGYGVVYKASLPDGRPVAVKVINEVKGDGEEFINEVASISRTSHVNIVSLLGYCYEVNKRVLIYEFMPQGSLDQFIYKSGFSEAVCDFNWNTLFQIAIGIAKGLEYLHQGCSSRILHLDIKPQNILLDEDFCPKISDFGLAKICQRKDSVVSILGTRGTIGYMAPEVYSRAFGGVSYKSDIYSYGMLILEMIGGRKNYDTGGSCTSEMYFPDWIYKDLEQGNTLSNCLTISEEENDMVRKITLVSLWCIQTKPSDRPQMNKVIEMLEGPLSLVPYPPKPVLCSPERPPLELSDMSSSNLYETNSITTSN
jgi:serine/threonine protein kinase